ncbi:MAG: phenylalanine--tRNA ligase beta subunit-related protein [Chloroflexota bacterium]
MPIKSRPTLFRIEESIFEHFPDVQMGVVLAFGIDNHGEQEDIITALRSEEERVTGELAGTVPADHPHIAPWREAYRVFGANPKKYPSSIENLVGRVLRGNRIRHINKLVDIYNAVSLRYIFPVGGEDLDTMQGDILLTIASQNESPIVLLGEQEANPPKPGEVIYKDSIGAICRRWNWKEADRTKLTEDTTNVILIIEALPTIATPLLQQAVTDLASMLETYCGGRTTTAILNKQQPHVAIEY